MCRLRLHVRSVNPLRFASVYGREMATPTFVGVADKISQRSCYPSVGVGIPVAYRSVMIALVFNPFCPPSNRGLVVCGLKAFKT